MNNCDRPHRLLPTPALVAGMVLAAAAAAPCADQPAALRFAVSYEAQEEAKPLDGRILLLLSGPTTAGRVAYVGNSGDGPWIRNAAGVGAFTFQVRIVD